MENEQTNHSGMRRLGEAGTASFAISVSENKMNGYIQVFGKGSELTMQDIVSGVKEAGISKGVSRKVVDLILEGKHDDKPVLFAKGIAPVDGEDGWYEFFFRPDLQKMPKLLEDGSVDYQNVEWFEVVTEDQKLLEYHPAGNGTVGYNVYGEEIPAKKGKDLPQVRGAQIRVSEDKINYYANIGGRITYENMKIDISRLFVIDELSLATGNLVFDGCIHVTGNVGTDIILKATEDIVIDGFVESARIECGGSIMFRQGMNGSGEGTVKAKDFVAGKFFEAVKVDCQGSIQADYFLNCSLFASEDILVSGKKGSIAGGKAYAMHGFIARNIGNRAGIVTNLRVGTNDNVLRRQLEIEDSLINASKSLQKLRHARSEMEAQYSAEECLLIEKYNKIVDAIESNQKTIANLEKESEEMASYVDRLRKAQIVVNNTLYDGVICELNNQKIEPSKVKNVTIRMTDNRIAIFENRGSK